MSTLALSLSALVSLVPATLLPFARQVAKADLLFWLLLAAAIAGPAGYSLVALTGQWESSLPAALWLAGLSPWLIFAFTAIQGAAIGVMTILRPVLISEVLGPAGYGAIAGTIQIPARLAGAAAPVVGAFVLDHTHVPGLIALSAGLVGLSSLLAWRLAGQQD